MNILYGFEIENNKYFYNDDNKCNKILPTCDIKDLGNVITRKDTIRNLTDCDVILKDYSLLCVVKNFTGDILYYSSDWCNELTPKNWNYKDASFETFSYGRTSSKGYPYILLKEEDDYVALNLIPNGDWYIKGSMENGDLYIRINRGEDAEKILAKEEKHILLDMFLVKDTDINRLYLNQQKHVRKNYYKYNDRNNIPIAYNTWLDRFYMIDWKSLTRQVYAAKEIGCDVFIVDAGWFGEGDDWSTVGNWVEKKGILGDKDLRDFADFVRDHEMGFGIWMEPERIHESTPFLIENKDLFIQAEEKYYYPDLTKKAAYNWVFNSICNIIKKYDACWLKIDCNYDFAKDIYHNGHVGRMLKWHNLLEDVKNELPNLIIEGCAGGGMRNDLNSMSSYPSNYLSDTVNLLDVLRIGNEQFKICPPAMISKWFVGYPINDSFTMYSRNPVDTKDQILNPNNALCESVTSYSMEFTFAVNFIANLGVSCNLAGFSPEARKIMKKLIKYYKTRQGFIRSANFIPIEQNNNKDHYIHLLISDDYKEILMFVYNIVENKDPVYGKTDIIDIDLSMLPYDNYEIYNDLTNEKLGNLKDKKYQAEVVRKNVKILHLTC